MIRRILAWAQRNERHLGAAVFFFGFITDIVALLLLDVTFVLAVSGAYLAVATTLVLLTHALAGWREAKAVWKRSVTVILPLVAQYLIGNLLSWFLIFYTKSATLEASWPFLLLLLAVFAGNEWFRKYKDRLAFVTVLLFFTAYAYAIFALPLFVRALGPWVFAGSTLLAVGALGLFLLLMRKVAPARLEGNLRSIGASCAVIVTLVTGAYITGLVPPIPLALADKGIFHDVRREGEGYAVLVQEGNAWWDIRPDQFRVPSGSPLYAYSAVQAPIRFGATVVHRWQRYDTEVRVWVTRSRVAFPIAGGRAEGYRGYSQATTEPGQWRVRVETDNGQVIGQMRFSVERAQAAPLLWQEYR